MTGDRLLILYLRLYASLLLAALPAALVPTSWLAGSYAWLGLGAWPPAPLLEYLARSASGLYAFVGATVLVMSFDPPRYRPLLRLLGWFSMPAAVYLCSLDFYLALPAWWAPTEGVTVSLSGTAILLLTRATPTPSAAPSAAPAATTR